MQFPDGHLPSKELIKQWLATVDEFFAKGKQGPEATLEKRAKTEDSSQGLERRNTAPKADVRRIGVHCLAGLGRAPFFVAIALVNNGCTPINAIDLIRKNRPGAFNLAQCNYILEFKGKVKSGEHSGTATCECIIF